MKYRIPILIGFIFTTFFSFGQKKQVLLFLLEDCVICQSYSNTLRDLHSVYGSDFDFLGYFPNFASKPEAIESFKQVYDISFPLKTDYFKTVTNKFKVKVTPEVVIYDPQSDSVLYQGRIDDEFFEIGQRRSVVTQQDLRDALQAISSNSNNYKKNTKSIGCFINFDPINKKP
jgi:hypothetical protein